MILFDSIVQYRHNDILSGKAETPSTRDVPRTTMFTVIMLEANESNRVDGAERGTNHVPLLVPVRIVECGRDGGFHRWIETDCSLHSSLHLLLCNPIGLWIILQGLEKITIETIGRTFPSSMDRQWTKDKVILVGDRL